MRDGRLASSVLTRRRSKPFTDKQIELVSTFAAQAVIAIENTRLLNELRQRTDDLTESLEQQTATCEVLKVISSSPGELEPVFNAMLENATRICEAKFGILYFHENGAFRMASTYNTPPALTEYQRNRGSFQPRPDGRIRSPDANEQPWRRAPMMRQKAILPWRRGGLAGRGRT